MEQWLLKGSSESESTDSNRFREVERSKKRVCVRRDEPIAEPLGAEAPHERSTEEMVAWLRSRSKPYAGRVYAATTVVEACLLCAYYGKSQSYGKVMENWITRTFEMGGVGSLEGDAKAPGGANCEIKFSVQGATGGVNFVQIRPHHNTTCCCPTCIGGSTGTSIRAAPRCGCWSRPKRCTRCCHPTAAWPTVRRSVRSRWRR